MAHRRLMCACFQRGIYAIHIRPEAWLRWFPAAIEEAPLRPDVIVSTVPGFLDKTSTSVLLAANIPELNGCALAEELSRETRIPVILERDSVLALMGEYAAGGCKTERSVLGLFFGTGVGAAYLEDGRAFRGSGWALEIGHMPYNGSRRWLGADREPCLEAFVSGKVLEHIAQEHNVAISEVFTAAKHTPKLAGDVADFVRNQANAVGIAIAVLSPETILLGGGICNMTDFPREKLVSAIKQSFPFDQIGQPAAIRWATLGWQSVLHGAYLMYSERDSKQD